MNVLGGAGPWVPRPQRFVLPLLDSRRESPSAMTFRFSTKGIDLRYRSTQAIRLALPGVDDPWGAARTFSLSSSPTEPELIAITCRISDTPFKQALARLQPGETAEVFGPLGLFLLELERPSVLLAGGIGVTPFRGMLRNAADQPTPGERRLLYSARIPEELVFRSEIDAISRDHPSIRAEYSITRPADSLVPWDGRVGRIDAAWIRAATASLDRPKFYVAGLPEMVEQTVTTLMGPLGVVGDDIDYEVFRGF